MKKHAPATLRNREAILAVLRCELPEWGVVLEVASGSGEHAAYFAHEMRGLSWQPSDPDPEAIASILAYTADYSAEVDNVNLRPAVSLDAAKPESWPVQRADAIFCANMIHISPWAATEGLFAGAARVLETDAPMILYGPYFESGVEPAPSNIAFDRSLRSRNPEWGIRSAEKLDSLAQENGFARTARYALPANNLMLVYRVDENDA